MLPPAVTLNFDVLIPKANQRISKSIYNCDPNSVKFPSLVVDMLFTSFSDHCLIVCGDHDLWPFDPSTSTNRNTSVPKTGWNFLHQLSQRAAKIALQAMYVLRQIRPSVCLSVRPSHSGIVPKWGDSEGCG